METSRPVSVSSVVTIIIITVSKTRSLNFYQRQSLKFTICLTFLKKGNSPWPIILQDLGSERLSQEFASDFPSFIFSTHSACGSLIGDEQPKTGKRRTLLPGGPGVTSHLLYGFMFGSYKPLISLSFGLAS